MLSRPTKFYLTFVLGVVYFGAPRWSRICDIQAGVAELADAHDSKSCSLREWGFDSLLRHWHNKVLEAVLYLMGTLTERSLEWRAFLFVRLTLDHPLKCWLSVLVMYNENGIYSSACETAKSGFAFCLEVRNETLCNFCFDRCVDHIGISVRFYFGKSATIL